MVCRRIRCTPSVNFLALKKALYKLGQAGFYNPIPLQETMEQQKPAPTEDHSFQRELRVGLAGLGMAAGLITIFLIIMSYLATIVHQHFSGSLPFFLDKG